jgi:diguanylate cyclase (GGDEF)-like protein
VFCLFSEGKSNEPGRTAGTQPERAHSPKKDAAALSDAFANRLIEQNTAKILAQETRAAALQYELELKRRGFRLLSELSVSLRQEDDYRGIFVRVAQRINAALNMQKTVVLHADSTGRFAPIVLQGFTPEEQERLGKRSLNLSEELLARCPAVTTSVDSPALFSRLREEYALPFFVASPIYSQGKVSALLLTGRTVEQEPYLTRLSSGDLETVQAITELLGSVLVRLHLQDITVQAETDGLTGLWNRNTFQRMVEEYLSGRDKAGAFMMLDVDYFKSINDTYGHIAGDAVLKDCAGAMRRMLRDSDILARQGGDEFVVFCRGIKDGATAEKKAAQISEAWEEVTPGVGRHVTASIGIALSPLHGATYEELYNNADAALYAAKERGRACYVLFEPHK